MSQNTLPYIGSRISLVSSSDIRYEGTLYTINTQESTVALSHVRSFGTEGRKVPDIPPSTDVYDFIVFRGKDIKDLTVCEPPKPMINDPAIVAIDMPPQATVPQASPAQTSIPDGQGHHGSQYNERLYGGSERHGGYDRNNQSYNQLRGQNQNSGGGNRDDHRPPHRGGYYGGYQNYGGGRRYGGGYSRGSRGGRHIVGELPAQPNQAVKSQVSGDFDFEGANQKFEKGQLKAEELEKEGGVQMGSYDNKSSFFDSISCEALDRKAGHDTKVDREKQREVDSETFGASAVHRGTRFRRGFRRGGNFRRGVYGGGYGGYSYGGGRGF